MKLKTLFPLPVMAIAALIASIGTACAQTELLTFDDITDTNLIVAMPAGYGGLQWTNFFVLNTVQDTNAFGDNGGVNGVVSRPNIAFNGDGTNAFIFDNSGFNLNSAYLAGAWNDGLQVNVEGFVNGTLTYDNTYTVNTQGSTLINFDYVDVDEVEFTSYGGVPHGYDGAGTQFAMDNLSVTLNPVPEPSTFTLAELGGVLLTLRCLTQRWRQRYLHVCPL